ncbi:LuxR C-terminal-related transcriptional regulator [Actinokineospora sp. PR83]|uniref:ATP-binding protein n=1 Tax=Actinokineospora sp. PR83 TaxID=2884908 RepID=UPI001F20061F|nr:LuxR C-terminal-related transcriptional regulator [Actinokineospora sp. PR83]MCG8918940.1 LuxR C-terminal-related transcriptional regulator [Actinokineospora sp. PR83]
MPPVELTSFLGRAAETAAVRRLLDDARLVTLTGPGGVGKTRLALAVAGADDPVFVALADVRDPDLLPAAVAGAFGLHDRPGQDATRTVLHHLAGSDVLLLLDNCEHLVEAAARFAHAVLAACRGVVVLATSRQSLGVPGERVFPVPPLPVPAEPGTADPLAYDPLAYDGVRLFVERADRGFALTAGNAADVARLCTRLDGLPLAIELAAARARSLAPRQILDRLDHRLLTSTTRGVPDRQQTLRATIAWSHDLCTGAERALWARVSVFAGSFDLPAATAVCADLGTEATVLGLVDGLLDKSVLLREETAGDVRYRMLETLREFGREELEAAGELTAVSRRHRDVYDRLTAAAEADWAGPRQARWVAALRAEHANLRAALEWSLTEPGEAPVALRMAARVEEYWTLRGSVSELRRWLDRALAAVPGPGPERAHAAGVAALAALWHYDTATTAARLAEAGDTDFAAFVRALAAMLGGDSAEGARRAAAVVERVGDDVRRALHPMFILGVCSAIEGDLDGGRRVLHRAVDLADDAFYLSMAHYGTAVVEVLCGDVGAAERACRAGLRADAGIHNLFGSAHHVEALAWVAVRSGAPERAAELFGAAATLWELVGVSPRRAASLAGPHTAHVAEATAALGEQRFAEAHAHGHALPVDAVRPFALGESGPPRLAGTLTRREAQVAGLVAEGLTNREIAAKLVISTRTADTHVQRILAKLGLRNRTQVTTWAHAQFISPAR